MLRKLIVTAVLVAGTVAGVAPATTNAHEPIDFRHEGRFARYEVFYRHRGHWDNYGTYRDRDDAERAARQLRWRGFDVRIEREQCG